jgi:hypothetical protein
MFDAHGGEKSYPIPGAEIRTIRLITRVAHACRKTESGHRVTLLAMTSCVI